MALSNGQLLSRVARFCWLLGALLTLQTRGLAADSGGGLDLAFDPGSSITDVQGLGVLSMALQPDGKVVIGGAFTTVHGAVRGRIARLNADGSTDLTFLNGLAGADNKVECVALQPDGKVIIGGFFLQVNGVSRSKIARLNPDGSLDTAFQNGLAGVTGGSLTAVHSIALQPNGKILIAGEFASINGVTRIDVARLENDGRTDATFQNPAINGEVLCVVLQSDGKVLIGGNFNLVSGVTRSRIARLNSDGTLDATFQNGMIGANNNVRSIVVQPDGKIAIGGDFESVNGMARRKVAQIEKDGVLDLTFGNVELNGGVSSIALQADGKLLIGGAFAYYTEGLVSHGGVSRLNVDGTLDDSFDSGLSGANNPVDSLLLQPDGLVLIGGRFTEFNGIPRVRIARVKTDGTLDTTFENGPPGADGIVEALALQSDGKLLIGGGFKFVNDAVRRGIARLNTDGTLDTGFQNQMTGVDAHVFSIAATSDNKILIAGNFGLVNGVPRLGIARLNSDGSLDSSFQNPNLNTGVSCVALQSDGKVLIAGNFNLVNRVARSRIARLNANGTLDTNFLNGLAGVVGGNVQSMTVQSDSKVLIGGLFTAVNGTTRNRIARLMADGSLDTGFLGASLAGANNKVTSVAVLSDGKILIAGDFTFVNGTARNRIARLNTDGSLDPTFLNGLAGVSAQVLSIASQPDGKVVIGGLFSNVNGVTRNNIARLTSDGSLDTTFQNGLTGASDGVFAVTLDSDGSVVIGGLFNLVNAMGRDRVARLYGVSQSSEATLDFGDAPLIYRTRKADDGARHGINPPGLTLMLGSVIDYESDGVPSSAALSDDTDASDDEEGVATPLNWPAGSTMTLPVTISGSGLLNIWVDWNQLNGWADAGEHVISQAVSGPVTLTIPVPPSAKEGNTFARFRLSRQNTDFYGSAPDGEVEDYLVRIQPSQPENSDCQISCSGEDFWITFPGNYAFSVEPVAPRLCITGTSGTTVTIASRVFKSNISVTLPASGILETNLDAAVDLGNSNEVNEEKGIHVTASAPITVYGLSKVDQSSDGYLALPTEALGTSYIVAAYGNVQNGAPELGGTEFAIVSTEPSTEVRITPSSDTGLHSAGQPFNITLASRGDTYQFRNTDDGADLTGTLIESLSGKPIAVFSGHRIANINSTDLFFADYLVEHLLPTSRWGTEFYTAPFSTRSNYVVRIVAGTDATSVNVGGARITLAHRGDFYETNLTTSAAFSANRPVLAVQYATSSDSDGVSNGDPFMVTVPAVSHFGTSIEFCTPSTGFGSQYVNIIVPQVSVTSVKMSPSPLSAVAGGNIDSTYAYLIRSVLAGQRYTVTADAPIGVIVYGWNLYESYGWPACLSLGDGPPKLHCLEDIVIESPTSSGRIVNYEVVASDDCDTDVTVACNPPSGSVFPVGTTVVECTATDSAGNTAACSFSVTIIGEGQSSDWGDAPSSYLTSAPDGARHLMAAGWYLGQHIDTEANGIPSSDAMGDDTDPPGSADDEDGVRFLTPITAGLPATVEVVCSTNGYLDAWIDFNRNGGWESTEQIFANSVVTGTNHLSSTAPVTSFVAGPSYARFRFSEKGGLGVQGLALQGEVEDYTVELFGNSSGQQVGVAQIRITSESAELQYTADANFYYVLYRGDQVAAISSPVSLALGENRDPVSAKGMLRDPDPPAGIAFYRVEKIPVSQPKDSDADGIDDVYELRHSFLNPLNAADASADFDNDGLTNLTEYKTGTDPAKADVGSNGPLDDPDQDGLPGQR